jgi:Zn-dependent protease with chaperone function
MSESRTAKSCCGSCGVHLEFPVEAAGTWIACPGCGQQTELGALLVEPPTAEPAQETASLTAGDIAAAFTRRVPPTSTSLFYQFGLLLVTAAMVLLPVLYAGLIAAAGWAVYFWATHFHFLVTSLVGGPRVFLLKLVLYCGPLFAGVVLVFFMVKPFFAPRPRHAQPLALNPAAEPLLFSFIAKVCETVGAPFPRRIDLDCQLNAAAGFRRGTLSFLGNDLVLTIGLPLVAGLNLREFAGVLAHEFGHFTQGFGMRLSYVIRGINAWFARVVYQRDEWDLWLAELADTQEWWLSLVVACAKLAVWFSRQLLTGLMYAGHTIGCFMLRQMEYDADSYEIKLAGSEVFETTTRRMHLLGRSLEPAYKNMRVSWNQNRRLPENFPAYLLGFESAIPSAQREKLEDTMGLAATGLFDTHPSQGDRIRRARQAAEPGVFHLDGPSSALFVNFDVPAKQVTLLHYTDDLGIPVVAARLEPVKSADVSTPTEPPSLAAGGQPPAQSGGPRVRLKRPTRVE